MTTAYIYTGTLFSSSQPASGAVPLAFFVFAVATIIFGAMVGGARRKFHIPYPTMYAVPGTPRYYAVAMRPAKKGAGEAVSPPDANITDAEAYGFNCVQRGHQNFVENAPFVLAALVGAWPFPIIAAAAAILHIIGRFLYMIGYSRNPASRIWGAALIYPSLLTLFALDIASAVFAFRGTAPY
jgi:glutathione S-transferase